MNTKKIKINILDIVVIIFILSTILGLFVRTRLSSVKVKGESKNIIIEININDNTKNLSQFLNSGDTVKTSDGKVNFGTIENVVNRNNIVYVEEDGIFIKKFNDDMYRILVQIDSNVVTNEKGTFIDGKYYIAPGLIVKLTTENCEFEAEIIDIKFR